MKIWQIIFIIILVNGLTFRAFRAAIGTKPALEQVKQSTNQDKVIYFIPGLANTADGAFDLLLDAYEDEPWNEANQFYLQPSHFGWNPRSAAQAIARHAGQHGYTDVEIVAVSQGCQVLKHLDLPNSTKLYAEMINPCLQGKHLAPTLRKLARPIMPLWVIAHFAMGWINLIPAPTPSLETFYEGIYWILYDSPQLPWEFYTPAAHIILSNEDNLLENNAIKDFFKGNKEVKLSYINAPHGATGDPAYVPAYLEAIQQSHADRLANRPH